MKINKILVDEPINPTEQTNPTPQISPNAQGQYPQYFTDGNAVVKILSPYEYVLVCVHSSENGYMRLIENKKKSATDTGEANMWKKTPFMPCTEKTFLDKIKIYAQYVQNILNALQKHEVSENTPPF